MQIRSVLVAVTNRIFAAITVQVKLRSMLLLLSQCPSMTRLWKEKVPIYIGEARAPLSSYFKEEVPRHCAEVSLIDGWGLDTAYSSR